MERFEHHPSSLCCAQGIPNSLLRSSRDLGWSSILLDHHEGIGDSEVYETPGTPDVTLVVAVRGQHRIEVFSQNHWRSAVYQRCVSGMRPAMETARMRWSSVPRREAFETAHLYLPSTLIESICDEYRRVGLSPGQPKLSALVFRDPVVASCAFALLEAVKSKAPDLYAEQSAHWLATHLLAHHVGWWDAAGDRRQAAMLTDRRLARVVEFISSRLAGPLTIADMAREAGISPHHFARRFREETGLTPFDYLVNLRMEEAGRLLRHSDLSVASVSQACGYVNPAAFTVAFARRFGSSPTIFRQSMRSGPAR